MAYMTKGLSKMQVFDKNDNIINIKPRTQTQIIQYLKSYMTDDEIARYQYVDGSQFVSENNGYTYANFLCCNGITTLMVYDNPEL